MTATKLASAMQAMLTSYGDRFSGNCVEDVAAEWVDHGFDAADADHWCEIGVWDAAVAAEFRNAGLTAGEVKTASDSLVDGMGDPAEEYTDGDPIYAACNGDIKASIIIEAAK